MFLNGQFLVVLVVTIFLTMAGLQFASQQPEYATSTVSYGGNSALAAAASLSFDATVGWVKNAGYVAIFLAMLVEGPIITAAAAFGAALGFFNIWIILILAILGDLVADLIYYAIGYFSRVTFIEKFGHRFGLSRERMQKLEHLLHTHPTKTLLFIKLAPVLPTPGLMLVGTMRMPLPKYTTLSSIIILPKVLLFAALGYYFGSAYDAISRYAQAGEYFIVVALAVVVGVYWLYQKGSATLAARLQTV